MFYVWPKQTSKQTQRRGGGVRQNSVGLKRWSRGQAQTYLLVFLLGLELVCPEQGFTVLMSGIVPFSFFVVPFILLEPCFWTNHSPQPPDATSVLLFFTVIQAMMKKGSNFGLNAFLGFFRSYLAYLVFFMSWPLIFVWCEVRSRKRKGKNTTFVGFWRRGGETDRRRPRWPRWGSMMLAYWLPGICILILLDSFMMSIASLKTLRLLLLKLLSYLNACFWLLILLALSELLSMMMILTLRLLSPSELLALSSWALLAFFQWWWCLNLRCLFAIISLLNSFSSLDDVLALLLNDELFSSEGLDVVAWWCLMLIFGWVGI